MRIHPPSLASLALAFTLSAALPAAPAEAPAPAGAAPAGLPRPELQLRAATPRVRELLTTWDARELQLAELRSQLAATTDRTRSAQLESEIERFKFETDLEMLRIQAQHARRDGHVEMAEQLEDTAARLAAQRLQPQSKSTAPAVQIQLAPPAGGQQ